MMASSSSMLLLLYFFFSLIICVHYHSLLVLSCSTSDLTCNICPNDGDSRGNDVQHLPRYNAMAHPLSNDLGAYIWVTCDDTGNECTSFFSSLPTLRSFFGQYGDDSNPINYVESLVAYTIFGLCCALLSILTLFIFLCCSRSLSSYSCSGCCRDDGSHDKSISSSSIQRWAARSYMVIFLIFLFLWIGLGYFQGNQQMEPTMKEIITSPLSFIQTFQSLQQPLANTLVLLANTTINQTIININSTINQYVNIETIAQQFTNLSMRLTQIPTSLNNITDVFTSLSNITSNTLSGIQQSTTNINTTLAPLTTVIVPQLNTVNNSLTLYLNTANQLSSSLSILNISYVSLSNYRNNLDNILIPQLNASLSLYSNLPNNNTLNAAAIALSPLSAINNTNPLPTESARQSLLAQLNSILTAINRLPNYLDTAISMTSYNNIINTLVSLQLTQQAINGMNTVNNTQTSLFIQANTLNQSYNTLSSYLRNISLYNVNSAVNAMISLNTSLSLVPPISSINSALQVFDALYMILPLLEEVSPEFDIISTYLIAFSSNTTNSTNIIDTYINALNTTLPSASNTFASTSNDLSTFLNSYNNLNLNADMNTLLNIQNTINTQQTSLLNNNTFFSHSLNSLSATLFNALNISQHRTAMQIFQILLSTTTMNLITCNRISYSCDHLIKMIGHITCT